MARCASRAFWVTSRNRQMFVEELFRLQGFRVSRLDMHAVSERAAGNICGNAFSMCVVRRIVARILPAVGLAKPFKKRKVGLDAYSSTVLAGFEARPSM